jgi:hypothetical protein
MTPFEEFEALNRIFKVIKNYRLRTEDDPDLMKNDLVNAYLVNHLLSQDLQLWLRLEAQASLFEVNTNWDFEQLLRQFKRASHGLSESWRQSHSLN